MSRYKLAMLLISQTLFGAMIVFAFDASIPTAVKIGCGVAYFVTLSAYATAER